MFKGRKLVIATQHHKEQVIAPLLEKALGVHCYVTQDLDTDALGSFSGEVERKLDPLNAAREKCRLAMQLSDADLAVASEGSFGPHPYLLFIPSDEEIVLLKDRTHKLEIYASVISTETNFSGQMVATENELLSFAEAAQFPSHALIIKPQKNVQQPIFKGIQDEENLISAFRQIKKQTNSAYVETDMRAMYNPSRMAVIKEATQKLIEKVQSLCPNCGWPGYDIIDQKPGLTCEWCGRPTDAILTNIFGCKKCNYTSEKWYPGGRKTETAGRCPYCNP